MKPIVFCTKNIITSSEAGSVVIKLNADYLETLAEGSHTLTARFEDGSADADFVVTAAGGTDIDDNTDDSDTSVEGSQEDSDGAQTGDPTNLFLPLILLIAAAVTGMIVFIRGRRA